MIRNVTYSISLILQISLILSYCQGLWGQGITFDTPALAPATIVGNSNQQQIVQVALGVSVTKGDAKLELTEVRIEVFWNRHAFPLVGYGPNTSVHSKYDGPITVERKTERQANLGAKVSSGYLDYMSGSLEGNIGKKDGEIVRYNEIPQHEILVASGPIKRGTGAYFQFRPSRTEFLEGGRDLIVTFAVPLTWRGGVLQVNCQAQGKRKRFASFYDDVEQSRVFVVPIYLEGDDQARDYAHHFTRSEQQLRQDWSFHVQRRSDDLMAAIQSWFHNRENEIPEIWMHHLIQSGYDVAMDRYKSRLPANVATAANEFVEARRNLLELSR